MRRRVTWILIAALIVTVSLPVGLLANAVLVDGVLIEPPTPRVALSEPDNPVSLPAVSLLASLFFRGPPTATLSA